MNWLTYIIAIPTFVWGIAYVGLMMAIGAAHRPTWRGRAILHAQWRPWVRKIWKYATTVGRGVITHPDQLERVWKHEKVHVRQGEDLCGLGVVLGCCGLLFGSGWEPAVFIWMGSLVGLLVNYLMAGLRLGWDKAYDDAEHERAAYSQDDHDHG